MPRYEYRLLPPRPLVPHISTPVFEVPTYLRVPRALEKVQGYSTSSTGPDSNAYSIHSRPLLVTIVLQLIVHNKRAAGTGMGRHDWVAPGGMVESVAAQHPT